MHVLLPLRFMEIIDTKTSWKVLNINMQPVSCRRFYAEKTSLTVSFFRTEIRPDRFVFSLEGGTFCVNIENAVGCRLIKVIFSMVEAGRYNE